MGLQVRQLHSVPPRCWSAQGSSSWLRRFTGPAELERLLWITRMTGDPVTHARALDLVVAVLHAHMLRCRGLAPEDTEEGGEGGGGGGGRGQEQGTGDMEVDGGAAEGQGAGGRGDCVAVLLELGLLRLVCPASRQCE